jgi:hypothetical protein
MNTIIMAREKIEVAEGIYYIVFTPEETGAPELHEGQWHFEPVTDYDGGGDVFSSGYPNKEAAIEAARKWFAENE